jgi:exosortase A
MSNTTAASLADSLLKPRWAKTGLLLLLVLAVIVALFHETAWSIVSIWIRSETYAHGFLIVPISLWLVWGKRASLANLAPQPAYLPIALMLGVGFAWLLGYLVDVLVVKQLAFVGVLVLAIWAVIGTPAARVLAFPIGFLFFAVPVGEALIHPLMNFTAHFTVHLLRLTGIPVYQEGTFFSIPTGEWSVVEGCSGLRYLIASVTLGVLYAYLTYTKLWKRLLFVVISIGVPIIANGLRAYMIVMIAYLSGNKLALGIDHLIYGWVFFGIVVTLMFVIGAFWRDPPQEEEADKKPVGAAAPGSSVILTAAASVLVAAVWPAAAWTWARTPSAAIATVKLEAPVAVDGWQQSKVSAWDWRPHVVNPDGSLYQFYVKDHEGPIGLYLGAYRSQRQGAELLSSQNFMIRQKHPVWSQMELTRRLVRLDDKEELVKQSDLKSKYGQRLLAWYWYRVGNRYTGDQYIGKFDELLERVFAHRRDGAFIAVTTQYEDKEQGAAKRLQAFLDQMLPSIERELERALREH